MTRKPASAFLYAGFFVVAERAICSQGKSSFSVFRMNFRPVVMPKLPQMSQSVVFSRMLGKAGGRHSNKPPPKEGR